MILRAGHKPTEVIMKCKLHKLARGQFITSQPSLARNWGWSIQNVRSLLKNLKLTDAITYETDHQVTVVTIVNYNKYQDIRELDKPTLTDEITDDLTGKSTDAQPTLNRRSTAIKKERIKEPKKKEDKNPPTPLPPTLLINGFDKTYQDWITYKSERKESYTPQGAKAFISKCQRLGPELSEQLMIRAMENNWVGLNENLPFASGVKEAIIEQFGFIPSAEERRNMREKAQNERLLKGLFSDYEQPTIEATCKNNKQ